MAKAKAAGHECIGLELNNVAAGRAWQIGLDVREIPLAEFVQGHAGLFDRVVFFQVLEHVEDPIGMLRDMKKALRPGGTICIAVPNAECFSRFADTLLDMPPHHVSRWSADAMSRIAGLLEAQSNIVEAAPLEEIHFDWFSDIWVRRHFGWLRGSHRLKPIIRRLLRLGVAERIRGHTLYAEFVVNAHD